MPVRIQMRVWVYGGCDAGAGAWRSRWSMGSGARERAGAAYAVYRSGYGDRCTRTCRHTVREVPGGRSERGGGGYAVVHGGAGAQVQGAGMWRRVHEYGARAGGGSGYARARTCGYGGAGGRMQ